MAIVVTRHPGLVEYLRETGIVDGDVRVISHADVDEIRGEHVIGVLPLHLASVTEKVTVVPLDVPAEMRGRELTVEEVRRFAGPPRTFKVREVAS